MKRSSLTLEVLALLNLSLFALGNWKTCFYPLSKCLSVSDLKTCSSYLLTVFNNDTLTLKRTTNYVCSVFHWPLLIFAGAYDTFVFVPFCYSLDFDNLQSLNSDLMLNLIFHFDTQPYVFILLNILRAIDCTWRLSVPHTDTLFILPPFDAVKNCFLGQPYKSPSIAFGNFLLSWWRSIIFNLPALPIFPKL